MLVAAAAPAAASMRLVPRQHAPHHQVMAAAVPALAAPACPPPRVCVRVYAQMYPECRPADPLRCSLDARAHMHRHSCTVAAR